MKDKNGIEITDGCHLRIKYNYGEAAHLHDGIYKVTLNPFTGIRARIIRIYEPEITFKTELSWEYRQLTTDYVNKNYDRLAVAETRGENHHNRQTWKEQHYSNDIEVVDFKAE